MSAPVDVLAVMDDFVASRKFALSAAVGGHAQLIAQAELDKAERARAAMFELIAAAKSAHCVTKTMQNKYRKGLLPSESSRAKFGNARFLLGQALARVGGAA